MRAGFAVALALGLVAAGAAAEPSGRVVLLREPDGTPRIVNYPGRPGRGTVPRVSASRRDTLWPYVEQTARAHGVDPELVDLVIRMESGYNPNAVSPKGARGVMQLMPATARQYGVRDVFDPHDNYNAGPEAVARHDGVPPYRETRNYVAAILDAYEGTPAKLVGGGFNAPSRPRRPVSVSSRGGSSVISNAPRPGEPTMPGRLALR
ncbi:MAG: Lytic transglycosylase catalytic [Acidobacteria bacterium]|nr:Lytic transglycosylase catalytic [Acidobacteriota bacterium]